MLYNFVFEVNEERNFVFPFIYNSWFAYEQMKWLENNYIDYNHCFLTQKEINNNFFNKMIPIGTIEFVHKFMNKLKVAKPEPLNIPSSVTHLTNYNYFSKKVKDISFVDLPSFIKPKKLKLFDGGVMEKMNMLSFLLQENFITEETEVLLRKPFSEELVVEYRIPVFNGEPFSAQPYNGIYSSNLDWNYIQDLCNAFNWNNIPYVIDVGIGENGTNYLIEFTHFYSVSLYGVEDVKLIKAQLRWWLRNVWSEF